MPTSIEPNAFLIDGIIANEESKSGISNLVVFFYNLKNNFTPASNATAELMIKNALRLGSTTTNTTGQFSFQFVPQNEDAAVLHNLKEGLNLFIVVAAPDTETAPAGSRIIYFNNPPRNHAGRFEHFNIIVSKSTLAKFGLADIDSATSSTGLIKKKVDAYIIETNDQLALADGVADFNKGLVKNELTEKKSFGSLFKGKLATNLTVAPFTGVVVEDDLNIPDDSKKVAEQAIDKANKIINADKTGVPVNLYLTEADRDRLFGTQTEGQVSISEAEIKNILLKTANAENPGMMLINNNPIIKFCREHSFDEKCAKEHVGLDTNGNGHHDQPVGSGTGSVSGNGTATNGTPITNKSIPAFISRLIDHMPSPDSVLDPSFNNKRPDKNTIENNVNSFSLNKGPADIPAFYDFHSLQIAFDYVWKQLFDEEIINLAHHANKIYKSRFGLDLISIHGSQMPVKPVWPMPAPSTIPPEVLANFEITNEEWQELDTPLQNKLKALGNEINEGLDIKPGAKILSVSIPAIIKEKYFQKLVEQGERIIESVRHDDYYTLHKTLRDLHERINSKYEFTVFAASKDFHSINFGILNTYRQRWEPLTYQVGKLVKTTALSPKEERKYSLKITRNLKHSSKEAIKNSSSVTNEQTYTSRVETDIINKALNKTNFNLSTQGTYNIGISKGKSTTSFGTEAQAESSNDRKDFRESVLKATQEYKDERSMELDVEETNSNEYTESGTIVNPNDELSVTYLFYELQRRYRISEQLHRIMPVVLVAQEVPSPDQITEAWVITYDWIINRFLLDDSFRPCLQYLSTKSVGDDFAIRELRRNLREQRNLVNTLKIELAEASKESESRYRALQRAIEKRIREEASENSDGWLSDSFESVFGGGEDPEAAKARELAAKDAHQYAVDKTEKLAAGLQQEVNNLHRITSEYNNTLRKHLDNEAQIKRLLVHIRSNIIYYMQTIWTMEPPDQRFLRLHKVSVADPEVDGDRTCIVNIVPEKDIFESFREPGTTKHKALLRGQLKKPVQSKSLSEVADLDTMLGFKGNYMIFPLKQHNAITEFMAAPYIDAAFGAMDPDQLSNISLEDYSRYVCCLHENLTEDEFAKQKEVLLEWLKILLSDPLRNNEEIIVPTSSVFIEALPGAQPLLENFKLRHRELDVYKVQAEVRKMEMENLRLAARLLNFEREDPDIEKKIVVDTGTLNLDVDTN